MTEAMHARRSEARFQTLVQNASDVILIVRPDTTITYQTPSARADPGLRAGGRSKVGTFTSLVHPDDVEQALAVYTGVAFRARDVGDGPVAGPAQGRQRGTTSR